MTMLSNNFCPSDDDGRAYRVALGRFATGVTVVTTMTEQGPVGFTANSFNSVSLEPPLVLWSPAKTSSRFKTFRDAERFAIHVMSIEQSKVSYGFAKRGDAFDITNWETCKNGVPLIPNCLSRFECTRHAVFDAGDHAIVVGQVHRVSTRPGTPLLFFGGDYGTFAPSI